MAIIKKAFDLILDAEGLDQPGKWSGGDSGISIGIGYDLGYVTVDQFESDWGECLSAQTRESLKAVIGMRGVKAKNRALGLIDIKVGGTHAQQVFARRSLPCYELLTAQAFPGYEALPPEVQGALVSLVYNRCASMIDKPGEGRRKEMREIRDAVEEGDLQEIADQLRSMKGLWVGKGLDGLLSRREKEAALVESAIA